MRPQIIYNPRTRRPGTIKRPTFTPFGQDTLSAAPPPRLAKPAGYVQPQSGTKPVIKQILEYIATGKPIATPVEAIKTEVIVPTETKKFARQIVFTIVGGGLAAIVLWQILK